MLEKAEEQLSMTCHETGEKVTMGEVTNESPTMIEFWTTNCGRCPLVLDTLNTMGAVPLYSNINFVSICCDASSNPNEYEKACSKYPNLVH